MGKYASEIVKLAQSWVGKKEANGTHKEIIDIYNAHKPLARGYKVKYTDHWCATTISALSIKLGYTDILPTECGCGQMIALFQKIGSWVENDAYVPKAGDIIFYDWDDSGKGDCTGWSDHVGIVENVSGNTITVIEGNYNEAVKRRNITVNARYIRGYGVPKYDAEVVNNTEVVKHDTPLSVWAREVVEGKHGNGHANREASLKKAGCTYPYEEVRQTVNYIMNNPKQQTSIYYPKYTGNSYGIDTVFRTIGVPENMLGNWKNRRTIAKANGIYGYEGKANENSKLISLAKRGLLKRP